jgi:hypothetical protein
MVKATATAPPGDSECGLGDPAQEGALLGAGCR